MFFYYTHYSSGWKPMRTLYDPTVTETGKRHTSPIELTDEERTLSLADLQAKYPYRHPTTHRSLKHGTANRA